MNFELVIFTLAAVVLCSRKDYKDQRESKNISFKSKTQSKNESSSTYSPFNSQISKEKEREKIIREIVHISLN